MGRAKRLELAGSPAPAPAAEAVSTSDVPVCGLCGDQINAKNEEHINVRCNVCGTASYHRECACIFLEAHAKEKTNSHAAHRCIVKARKRPVEFFEQRMPCPNGNAQLDHDKDCQPGSRGYRGKLTRVACSGFTQGAELIKPAKDPPAPLPTTQPARAPKKLPAAAPPAAKPPAAKKAATPAPSATLPSRGPSIVPAPGSGAAMRLLGARQPSWTAVGGAKKAAGAGPGGAKSAGPFPPGTRRPPHLLLCPHFLESGDCHIYRCENCHSEEEQRQREQEWAARQEGERREARRRELEAAEAAQARREEEAEVLAQLESLEMHQRQHLAPAPAPAPRAPWAAAAAPAAQRPPLQLSPRALGLLRAFKRSHCLNSLLEMGFATERAQAATDAAGGDAAAAVQLLMDGARCGGAREVDVAREVRDQGIAALAAGASAEAVEAQLAAVSGNWEVAVEALQLGGTMLDGTTLDGTMVAHEEWQSLAPSEPDTPSLGAASLPPWAADTASLLSAPSPSPQSPRAATTPTAGSCTVPDAAPGVLSLADFSSAPLALPVALPPSSASGGGDGYSDGFAAGLAAAQALLAAAGERQQYGGGTAAAWLPQPADGEEQQPENEEEIEGLMHMLGIA